MVAWSGFDACIPVAHLVVIVSSIVRRDPSDEVVIHVKRELLIVANI